MRPSPATREPGWKYPSIPDLTNDPREPVPEFVIVERAGRVVLPPTGDRDSYIDVSVWDDSRESFENFARLHYPNPRSTKKVITTAVLVHHGHNTYNRNAISVSTPGAAGGTVKKRHLGYLRDSYLRKVGMSNLPDLIRLAGGEVDVTVVLAGTDELLIDLPDGRVLSESINGYLEQHGLEGAPSYDNRTKPRVYKHSGRSADTTRTLRLIRTHQGAPVPVVGVSISTDRAFRKERRTCTLTDTGTGEVLGSVEGGILYLRDERNREQVLEVLADAEFPVAQPVTSPTLVEDGTWPADAVPNAFVRSRSGGLDLRALNPEEPHSQESFAIYNPTISTLWVEDSHLVAPALRIVHRMGLDPTTLGLPKNSWNLDHEVSYRSLRDPRKYGEDPGPSPRPHLLASMRDLLPNGVLTAEDVDWLPDDKKPALPAAAPEFLQFEKYVTARIELFPQHELTGALERCRLCASATVAFTTPISTHPLAYCQVCLSSATTGLGQNRDRAAVGLKELSVLEFDSQPMLETQLTSLHVNPEEPIDPTTIDKLLLLRFAIPRRHVAWTLLLEAAGFAGDGLRMARGTLIRSRDGHLCHSMRERAVCDFLHLHGIVHDREPRYPQDPDYNATGLRRADWELADGTLVELWGLPKDPAYAAKMEAKRNLVARHGLRLVELLDTDLPNLPTIFDPWINRGRETGWTWSPLLIATAATSAAQRKTPTSTGDDRGRNDFNSATQRERVARCAEVVAFQGAGLSRGEIAARMGTNTEGVKILLRDGKFYADPATDPLRHEIAKKAAQAREERCTRADFQAQFLLTTPKAQEAWRDAGVLFETGPSNLRHPHS